MGNQVPTRYGAFQLNICIILSLCVALVACSPVPLARPLVEETGLLGSSLGQHQSGIRLVDAPGHWRTQVPLKFRISALRALEEDFSGDDLVDLFKRKGGGGKHSAPAAPKPPPPPKAAKPPPPPKAPKPSKHESKPPPAQKGASPAPAQPHHHLSVAAKIRGAFKHAFHAVAHGVASVAKKIGHGVATAAKKVGHGIGVAAHAVGKVAKKAWGFVKTYGIKVAKFVEKGEAVVGKWAGKAVGFICKPAGKAIERLADVQGKVADKLNSMDHHQSAKERAAFHGLDIGEHPMEYAAKAMVHKAEKSGNKGAIEAAKITGHMLEAAF